MEQIKQNQTKSKSKPAKVQCTSCNKLVNDFDDSQVGFKLKGYASYIKAKPYCNRCFCISTGWMRDKIQRDDILRARGLIK